MILFDAHQHAHTLRQLRFPFALGQDHAVRRQLVLQSGQHLRQQPAAERRVQQDQVERAADVGEELQRLAVADIALPVHPSRFAVGRDYGQRFRRAVHKQAAFGPAGQRFDPQLAAARKEVQHPRARHQELHAGKHSLLDPVDRRAGDILPGRACRFFPRAVPAITRIVTPRLLFCGIGFIMGPDPPVVKGCGL